MIRVRKLIATLFLVAFITTYALLIMALAVKVLPDASGVVHLIFYAVAGLFWVLPAGLIIWLGWRGERAITPERR